MPHVTIECPSDYAGPLLRQSLLDAAHRVMMESGLFTPSDIKTRLYCPDDVRMGAGEDPFFVHVTVALLEGRSVEQRHDLSEAMALAFRLVAPDAKQLSVEVRELLRAVYSKSHLDTDLK